MTPEQNISDEQLSELVAETRKFIAQANEQLNELEATSGAAFEIDKVLYRKTLDTLLKRFSALTELQARRAAERWIPVSERLPEANDPVLLFCSDGFASTTTWGVRDERGEWLDYLDTSDDYPNDRSDVTHWRPLPPAPQEER